MKTSAMIFGAVVVLACPSIGWAAGFTISDTSVIHTSWYAETETPEFTNAGEDETFVAPGGNWLLSEMGAATLFDEGLRPLSEFALQHETRITATQLTATSHMTGIGRWLDDQTGYGAAYVTERLALTIDLATRAAFTFMATGSVVTDEEAEISGVFSGPSTFVEFQSDFNNGYNQPFHVTADDVLSPGRYFLTLDAILRADGRAIIPTPSYGYEVDLTLTPVPEPGTLALLVVGGGAWAYRQRRRVPE